MGRINGEIDKSTIVVIDLNTFLTTDETIKQNIKKHIEIYTILQQRNPGFLNLRTTDPEGQSYSLLWGLYCTW